MFLRNKIIQKKTVAMLLLPFAFLLTRCAEDFDAPTITPAPKVAEEVVSGLSGPFALAIVPESASAKPGQTLHHNDLLVANFGDSTIRQIDESTEPPTVKLFADTSDTTKLNQPTGIAFETKSGRGDVYVSHFLDAGVTAGGAAGGGITVFSKDGSFLRPIDHATLFKGARGIVYDAHHSSATQAIFFVSNLGNNTILKVSVDLTNPAAPVDTVTLYADLSFLGLGGKNPTQLAISPIEPHKLYAANTGLQPPEAPVGRTISIIPTDPALVLDPAGLVKKEDIRLILAGEVSGPLPLGFDDEGRLFTSDHAKGTLVMIDPQIGLRLSSVETGEANMYGMAVGEGGIYLTAVKGGRIIEVDSSLLTGEAGGGDADGGGHHG